MGTAQAPLPVRPVEVETSGAPSSEVNFGDNAERASACAASPPDGPDRGRIVALVGQISPLLASVIDLGLVGALGPEVGPALQEGLGRWLDGVELGARAEGLLLEAGASVSALLGAAAGDPSCCQALEGWLDGLCSLSGAPLLAREGAGWLQGARAAGGELEGLSRLAGEGLAGLVDALAPQALGLLEGLWRAIEALAALDEGAADWVSQQLGLAERPKGAAGLLEVLDKQLLGGLARSWGALLDQLSEALLALPPAERLYRVVDASLELLEAARWLRERWGEPGLLERAPAELGDNIAGGLVVEGLRAFEAAGAWRTELQEAGGALLARLGQASDAALGVPLLSGLSQALQDLQGGIGWVVASPLWGDLGALFDSFASFGEDVLWSLAEISFALATLASPLEVWLLLGSSALQLLPDCYQAPFFDALVALVLGWVQSWGAGLLMSLAPGLGPELAELLGAGLRSTLQALTARPPEQKARVLEAVVRLLSGESAWEAGLGLVLGAVGGTLGVLLEALAQLGQAGLALQEGLQSLLLSPLARPWRVLGAGLSALDALGDRRQAAAPAEPERGGEGQAGLLEALQELAQSAALMVALPGEGLRDPIALQEAFSGLWLPLAEGMGAALGAAAGALLDALVASADFGWAAGFALGQALASLVGEALLTRGLGGLARLAPSLASLLDGLTLLLRGDEMVEAALLQPVRSALDAARPFLSGLRSPIVDRFLASAERLLARLEPLGESAGEAPGEGAREEAPDQAPGPDEIARALRKAEPELRAALQVVRHLGPADLGEVAEQALLLAPPDRDYEAARASALKVASLQRDALLSELVTRGLPEGYDRALTVYQNVVWGLVDRTARALAQCVPQVRLPTGGILGRCSAFARSDSCPNPLLSGGGFGAAGSLRPRPASPRP